MAEKKKAGLASSPDDRQRVLHLSGYRHIGKIAFRIWFNVAYTTVTESVSELIRCKLQTAEARKKNWDRSRIESIADGLHIFVS